MRKSDSFWFETGDRRTDLDMIVHLCPFRMDQQHLFNDSDFHPIGVARILREQ
jgi:hypothetical protein